MDGVRKLAIEAINHLVHNDPELKSLNQGAVFAQLDIRHQDIGILLKLYRDLFSKSHSDLRQDVFVLLELGFKRNGFFVEFGACDGIVGSNTWLLEKEFSWSGILAEPNRFFHADLGKERSASIENKCVWSHSGEQLMFKEVTYPRHSGLSTIESFSESDQWAPIREQSQIYPVETISLVDMLDKHAAPQHIDYLSIDTEGSEYEILAHHDFDRYSFRIITCEHNFSPNREKIYDLLTGHGYVRTFEDVSGVDDWYVRRVSSDLS